MSRFLLDRRGVDPRLALTECQRLGLSTDWTGKVNRYQTQLGLAPGWGHMLLYLADLDALSPALKYKLTIDDGVQPTLELPNIRLCGTPLCLTPGAPRDLDAIYLTQIVDRRIDCGLALANRRYNCRETYNGGFATDSLNSASPWTWAEVAEDLWDLIGNLGTFEAPQALSDLASVPEQFDARGYRAVDVLEDVLSLAGFAPWYNPKTDKFTIIRVDDYALELDAERRQLRSDSRILWDDGPEDSDKPYHPKYARVLFPAWSTRSGADATAVHVVDVLDRVNALADGSGQQIANSYVRIHDYMRARVVDAAVEDPTDLKARAEEVADQWFRGLGAKPPWSFTAQGVYASDKLLTGKGPDAIVWQDIGGGVVTHVVRTPRHALAPIIQIAGFTPLTDGDLLDGDFSQAFYRQTAGAENPVGRAGGRTPSLERYYTAMNFSDQDGLADGGAGGHQNVLRGAGRGPGILRSGPLRWMDWAVDGAGGGEGREARPWRRIEDTTGDGTAFVSATSSTRALSLICDTVSADATIEVTTGNTNTIRAGMTVYGTGIPVGATVSSITDSNTFELSANASANGTGVTLYFGEYFDGLIQTWSDDNQEWDDGEAVYVMDANAPGEEDETLPTGIRWLGRMEDEAPDGTKVYAIAWSATDGGGGSGFNPATRKLADVYHVAWMDSYPPIGVQPAAFDLIPNGDAEDGWIFAHPFTVIDGTINRIRVWHSSQNSFVTGSGEYRVGIYDDNNFFPNSPLFDSGVKTLTDSPDSWHDYDCSVTTSKDQLYWAVHRLAPFTFGAPDTPWLLSFSFLEHITGMLGWTAGLLSGVTTDANFPIEPTMGFVKNMGALAALPDPFPTDALRYPLVLGASNNILPTFLIRYAA